MKSNETETRGRSGNVAVSIKNACVASCQKILARIAKAREAIFAEARQGLVAQEQLVRLALNEAEALAFQTSYPHLVFPALATEKIQSMARWTTRQQLVRGANSEFAAAA